MDGRIYLIAREGGNLDVVQSIRLVEDNKYLYTVKGKDYIATKKDIFLFAESSRTSNSLSDLICDHWRQKYLGNDADDAWYFREGADCLVRAKAGKDIRQEIFVERVVVSLQGQSSVALVGSEGTICLTAFKIPEGIPLSMLYVARTVWDSSISQDIEGYFICTEDISFYRFKVLKKDVGYVGYTPLQNTIYNFISVHPDGISSRDIESQLKMRHCIVAGRLSELKNKNRIIPKETIKYSAKGKPCTVWITNAQ